MPTALPDTLSKIECHVRNNAVSKIDRIYQLHTLLQSRRSISRRTLLDELEVSSATLKRDIEFLRSRMRVPVVWDRELGGYRIDSRAAEAASELPGLWFSAKEIHALLTMQHLLANLDPGGILSPHIQPLMERLSALLGAASDPTDELRRRVLILGVGKRRTTPAHFEQIGAALLRRKRLLIEYYARSSDEKTEREISPQRLVHYRENWYLDGWCHLRNALRSFSVDSIRHLQTLERVAFELQDEHLSAVLDPGYGIFSGAPLQWATLRFTAERARWVAGEHWHRDQRGHFERDGTYLLEIPFTDHRELLMDILKHGRHCEVLRPDALRRVVLEDAQLMIERYEGASTTGSFCEPHGSQNEDIGKKAKP